jgi:hypothetical protein
MLFLPFVAGTGTSELHVHDPSPSWVRSLFLAQIPRLRC